MAGKKTKKQSRSELQEWNLKADKKMPGRKPQKKLAYKEITTDPNKVPGKRKKRKKIRKGLVIVIVVAAVVLAGFIIYVSTGSYDADTKAVSAAGETENAVVSREGDDYFVSPEGGSSKGVILYPGGLVEHSSYLPLAEKIAEKGVACGIVDVPLGLAFFDVNACESVMTNHPEITEWYIGGHSLGGLISSVYADSHTDSVKGIVFLAAYPISDLSDTDFDGLVCYGTEDKVLDIDDFDENRSNLPTSTRIIIIDGGNHSQFGNYGQQEGDGEALISSDEQQKLTARYISEMINGG